MSRLAKVQAQLEELMPRLTDSAPADTDVDAQRDWVAQVVNGIGELVAEVYRLAIEADAGEEINAMLAARDWMTARAYLTAIETLVNHIAPILDSEPERPRG